MATSMIVCGAAGRMGRTLISLITQNPATTLVGAVEAAGHPALGQDAGLVAGVGPLGVALGDDLAAVAQTETVTLDFSTATAAMLHLQTAVQRRSAIVIGATGFSSEQEALVERLAQQTRTVVAPNMSVGIAVLQRLVRAAASTLGADFDPEIVEMHHRMKVDAPSGTALALGRTLADATGRDFPADAVYGRSGMVGQRQQKEIGILALRGGDVVGDHTVIFAGLGERIELTHRAQSRECLARGAIRAGLWLADQPPGRYGMSDVLGMR
ncbi:MAG: Dihydrodipicolinate reductase [Deltaproteobacteria bacterium]|nr:Dihydrodipicolinate reductase [Deltaproteobacteria bacterium]